MRLCLSIQRHALPQVKLLWKAPAESTTFAQLLEQINEVIPLESGGWGTEDYVASVQGYECLHFQDIHDVLGEGDEVSIAPLRSSDIRARVLSGRHQISADGRHLVDGVAFGKPYLKQSNRPEIHIPPRKRPRLTYEEDSAELLQLEDGKKQLRIQGVFDDADAPDSEDAEKTEATNTELPAKKRRRSVSFDEESLLALSPLENRSPGRLRSGRIRGSGSGRLDDHFEIWEDDDSEDENFEAPESDTSEDDSDGDTDLENLNPNRVRSLDDKVDDSDSSSSLSSSSEETSSDSSSETSSNSSSESEESDQEPDDSATLNGRSPKSAGDLKQTKKTAKSKEDANVLDPKATKRDAAHKSQDAQTSNTHSSTNDQPHIQQIPPGQGKKDTTLRNQRRKDNRQLAKLKSLGILPPTALRKDLMEYRARTSAVEFNPKADFEVRREKLLESIASGGVDQDDPTPKSGPAPQAELEESQATAKVKSKTRKQKKKPSDETSHLSDCLQQQASVEKNESVEEEEALRKRNRLDIASSRRLLFGSLGLKAPKSKAEEEALKTKLKTMGERKPVVKAVEEFMQSNVNPLDGAQDEEPGVSDDWKSKIELSAVECCDRNVKLSTPPFPFIQHWDADQQGQKRKRGDAQSGKKSKQQKKKLKAAQVNLQYLDEYNESFEDSNYNLNNDRYGAESQLSADLDHSEYIASHSPLEEDNLPLLPSDPSLLPDLKPQDIAIDTVIAYKQLEVSEATGWQPSISAYRTAVITNVPTEILTDPATNTHLTFDAKLANRDRSRNLVQFDENGRRIYGKFEMPDPDVDDDANAASAEEDSGLQELAFDNLLEPKILVATVAPTSPYAAVESQMSIVPDSLGVQIPLDADLSTAQLQMSEPIDELHRVTNWAAPLEYVSNERASAEDGLENIANVQAAQLPVNWPSSLEYISSKGASAEGGLEVIGSGTGCGSLALVSDSQT